MSSYVRRIGVEVYGNVSAFLASLNQMNAGITRTASGLRSGSREAGVFSNQLRAIGTTARYALAGELIFGITGAISKLSQLQVAIGNITTVATQPGGAAGLTGISRFRQELIDLSNQTITPVQNLTNTITALYSSLAKDLPQSDILNITRILSQTARTTQVADPQALVGTLLGGVTAYGMPQGSGAAGLSGSISKLGDQFYQVIKKSRNMTGEEYAQYSGNLYKRAGVAGLTPEQTGALAIQATMLGGPASTNMQNLSQFLLYLRNPKSKNSRAAYGQAGITQADLTSSEPNSGWAIIQKLITHANALPSGLRAQFISNAFGRMQSQSTFATLLKAGGLEGLSTQIKGLQQSVGGVKQGFDSFKDQAPLANLANVLGNLGPTLVSDIPGLNTTARAVSSAIQGFESPKHELIRHIIEGGVGAALGTTTLSRLFPNTIGRRVARIPGLGRLSGLGGKALSTGIMAEEAQAVSSGGATDGSRANPYWVIISPWSWTVGSPGGFGSPVGSTPPHGAEQQALGIFNKIKGKLIAGATSAGGLARTVGLVGGTVITAASALPYVAQKGYEWLQRRAISQGHGRTVPKGHPALARFADPGTLGASFVEGKTPLEQQILDRFATGKIGADAAERRLAALQSLGGRASQVTKVEVTGEAHGTFKVIMVDKNGNVIATVHEKGVPVKLWNAKQFPSHTGQPGTRKGGSK